MSKRITQEEKVGKEERVVARSKPMWNLVSKIVDQSLIAKGPSPSHSLETLNEQISNLDLHQCGETCGEI